MSTDRKGEAQPASDPAEDPHRARAPGAASGSERGDESEAQTRSAGRDSGPTQAEANRGSEIAQLIAVGVHPDVARTLRSREEPDPWKDKADEELCGLVANFGRKLPLPPGPMAIRPSSDAGDFVRYSGRGIPAAAHKATPERQTVVVAPDLQAVSQRDAPTVLLTGRKGRRSRTSRLGTAGVLVSVLLLATLGVRSWLRRHGATSDGKAAAAERPAGSAASAAAPPEPGRNIAPLELGNAPAVRPAVLSVPAPSPRAAAQTAKPPGSERRAAQPRRPADTLLESSRSAAKPMASAPPNSRQHYLLDLP